MLDRLHVENYKCLRDVTVDLGPFTVLIGPNDSGKSSFLDAIRTLGRTTSEKFPSIFGDDRALENLVWRKEAERNIVWEATRTEPPDPFIYHLEIPVRQKPPIESLTFLGKRVFSSEAPSMKVADIPVVATPGFTLLASLTGLKIPTQTILQLGPTERETLDACQAVTVALTSSLEFHFDPEKMAGPSVPQANDSLSPSGDNLAGVLDNLLSGPDRSAFAALEKDLHAAIPTIQGIALPPVSPASGMAQGRLTALAGAKHIEFVLSRNGSAPVSIPGSLASSGALLLTAFLALSHSKTPDLLLFEEPENGLHPSRLQLAVDVLRKMTTGELGGSPRQIVVTTHNPLLLNFAKPEEVRVFVRDPEKGTQVTPMTKIPDIDRLMKEFALGELWYLLGEEKLFAESPG